jgi:hypothetical protein
MAVFDPPMSVQPLTNVKPGSLMRWGSSNDPHGQKSLVHFNASARRFEWQYRNPQTVASYDAGMVVKPDTQSFSPIFTIGTDSGRSLLSAMRSQSYEPITLTDVARLIRLAAADRADHFRRFALGARRDLNAI